MKRICGRGMAVPPRLMSWPAATQRLRPAAATRRQENRLRCGSRSRILRGMLIGLCLVARAGVLRELAAARLLLGGGLRG